MPTEFGGRFQGDYPCGTDLRKKKTLWSCSLMGRLEWIAKSGSCKKLTEIQTD